MTDRSIIQLLNQRDERGLEETQRLYGQRLTRIAETLLSKEDAEECVNDVYTALWNRVPQDESDSLMPYLAAILRNLARMRWRAEKAAKRSAEIISLSDETAEIVSDPAADTEGEAVLRAADVINHYLDGQDPTRREMFILRYWYGWSIPEIAAQFQCSRAKAEKTLGRMKNDLKKEIRKQ